jgi:hypothetical protein
LKPWSKSDNALPLEKNAIFLLITYFRIIMNNKYNLPVSRHSHSLTH